MDKKRLNGAEAMFSAWLAAHPDASLHDAFMAGMECRMGLEAVAVDVRRERFRVQVLAYRGQYADAMLKDFYDYWTECGGRKMRFEKEKTFEVGKRLKRWYDNDFNRNCKNGYNQQQQRGAGAYGTYNARKERVEELVKFSEEFLQGFAGKLD